jgi:hypothetical protein
MLSPMSRSVVARFFHPLQYRREQERERRIALLRQRDGDDCRRCRRPLRFDLPDGHDQGPRIEPAARGETGKTPSLDSLCLTHGRCNAAAANHTKEVQERIRRKAEAELFAKAKRKRRAA